MEEPFFAPESCATERLLIRSYLPGDGSRLVDAVNTSLAHLGPFLQWAQGPQTERGAERIVRDFRARYLLNENFVLGLFTPDGREQIGGAGFHLAGLPCGYGNAEIGMWIRQSRARQGYGTEALRALLRWGFADWPWRRLTWRCDTRNDGSARTAEQAGMTYEGTMRGDLRSPQDDLRDSAIYAALRGHWQDPG